ncbi:MAG: NusG domain II-containing protein [Clostridia bacterium]|nr:NusG domain II-containing protein [Clostridia bacterium]
MNRSEQTDSVKQCRKRDRILIAAILLLAVMGIFAWLLFRQKGAVVEVSVNGETVAEYSLSEDRQVELSTGTDGQGRNTLVIRGGTAEVSDANCPDGLCAEHRAVSRDGESIVCLPNRLVITVRGE